MSPATIAKLRQRNAPYSLAADSFQAKQLSFERWQRGGLQVAHAAWFVLFVIALAALLAAVTQVRFGVALAAIVMILFLIALLLPAVQQAREAGRRIEAMADLKQLFWADTEVLKSERFDAAEKPAGRLRPHRGCGSGFPKRSFGGPS